MNRKEALATRRLKLEVVFTLMSLALLLLVSTRGYAAAGELDPSFGNGGFVEFTLEKAQDVELGGIALQSDGKLIVATDAGNNIGQAYLVHYVIQLLRFDSDGSLDTSFGTNGRVVVDFGPTTFAWVRGVAVLPDDKILVAGTRSTSTNQQDYEFLLMRFNRDGSLDKSFGTGGVVGTDFGGPAQSDAMAVDSDGRIILVGTSLTYPGQASVPTENRAIARYDPDGSLDQSFGDGGLANTPIPSDTYEWVSTVQIDHRGRILVGGASAPNDGGQTPEQLSLVRYDASGHVDPSFGTGGKVVTVFNVDVVAIIRSLVETEGGRIVAVGGVGVLAGYLEDGSLDPSFGVGGLVRTGPSLPGIETLGGGPTVLEPHGAIVIGGAVGDGRHSTIALVRYRSDGLVDASFGDDGLVRTPVGSGALRGIGALVKEADGKLVGAGIETDNNRDYSTLELVRYGATTCFPDPSHLCLAGSRFQVSVNWTNYNTGKSQQAAAVPLRDESGFFYFQDPANIEVTVKIHNACKKYGHYWFFSSATTNVAYTITVTDTLTGRTETYSNPAHVLSEAKTDQSSFSCN